MKRLLVMGLAGKVIATVLALSILGGTAFAVWQTTKPVPVDEVAIIPSGEITVSPTTLIFGDRSRGESFTISITVTNESESELIVTCAPTVRGDPPGDSDFLLCGVTPGALNGTYAVNESKTVDVVFVIQPDIPFGTWSNCVWNVVGELP